METDVYDAARLDLRGGKKWLRLAGLAVLLFLLWRVNLRELAAVLSRVAPSLLGIAVLLNIPLFSLKAFR